MRHDDLPPLEPFVEWPVWLVGACAVAGAYWALGIWAATHPLWLSRHPWAIETLRVLYWWVL